MRSFIVYLPYLIVIGYGNNDPDMNYWLAWFGSIFILFVTFTGITHTRLKDRTFMEQFFRPYIFTQLIFCFYHSLATIFYYFSLHGYVFFEQENPLASFYQFQLLAQCQSYCLLAHAAFAQGAVLMIYQYKSAIRNLEFRVTTELLIKISIGTLIGYTAIRIIGILSAIGGSIVLMQNAAIVLTFIYAVREKRKLWIAIALFIFNFVTLFISGMKEGLIILAVLLLLNLFPRYKIATVIIGIVLSNLIIYLPHYTMNVRLVVWYGGGTIMDAIAKTYNEVNSADEIEIARNKKTNWGFLINRISEIDALTKYVEYIDSNKDYKGVEILQDALMGIIPASFRTDGKTVDQTAQERAYAAGALDRFTGEAGTSAKPAMIADCYMVGGVWGVFTICFISGLLATYFSALCEKLFGGYTIGTVIISNAAFYVFFKGHCMENYFGALFYGILTIIALYFLNKQYNFFGNKELTTQAT